jgi:hypothetical protein
MRKRAVSLVQILSVAALCLAAVSARAADPKSPADNAHLVLKTLINKGIVAGDPEQNRSFVSYRGFRCHSTLEIRHDVLDIDWNLMTSVADFSNFAHAYGPVVRTDVHGMRDTEAEARFWLPNDDTAKQFADAMRALINSCAPKPKSD